MQNIGGLTQPQRHECMLSAAQLIRDADKRRISANTRGEAHTHDLSGCGFLFCCEM